MFVALTATANNAANIQIVRRGRIRAIAYTINGHIDADSEEFSIELSTVPTFQSRTNDAQGVLWNAAFQNATIGTEGTSPYCSGQILCDYPIEAGQLLYINAVLAGTNDVEVGIILHIQ